MAAERTEPDTTGSRGIIQLHPGEARAGHRVQRTKVMGPARRRFLAATSTWLASSYLPPATPSSSSSVFRFAAAAENLSKSPRLVDGPGLESAGRIRKRIEEANNELSEHQRMEAGDDIAPSGTGSTGAHVVGAPARGAAAGRAGISGGAAIHGPRYWEGEQKVRRSSATSTGITARRRRNMEAVAEYEGPTQPNGDREGGANVGGQDHFIADSSSETETENNAGSETKAEDYYDTTHSQAFEVIGFDRVAVHHIPAFQEESILSIRDPNYHTSNAFREYRKQREPFEREARERRLKRQLEADARGNVKMLEDGIMGAGENHEGEEEEGVPSGEQTQFDLHERMADEHSANDPNYEEVVFADGSAIRFSGKGAKAKTVMAEAHAVDPHTRRLMQAGRSDSEHSTSSGAAVDDFRNRKRKLLNLDDYSGRHFDRSDRRYRGEGFERRRLAVPGGLTSDNSFTTMPYRHPEQCERKACIGNTEVNCKEHLPGFYLRERGCAVAGDGGTQICTSCTYAQQLGDPTICQCEKVPFSTIVQYNEPCDSSRTCHSGECFRPCEFFLHVSTCPLERCMWNTTALGCVDVPSSLVYTEWASLVASTEATQGKRGPMILAGVSDSIFPLDFHKFPLMVSTYRIQGKAITNLITLVALFQRFDTNYDGYITAEEFEKQLTKTLEELENEATLLEKQQAVAQMQALENARRLLPATAEGLPEQHPLHALDRNLRNYGYNRTTGNARALQVVGNVASHQKQALSAEDCVLETPPKYFCSTLVICVDDCAVCGWKSATDREFFLCVAPSPESCLESGTQFCGADGRCHASCADCVGRPILDYSQNACLSAWWYTEPSYDTSTWICRHRRKVGRSCVHDQDCIYGLHKCLSAKTTDGTKRQCMPLRPYEETHICKSHYDCPHVDYYCPDDPTGNDPFWIKYCRMQLGEGRKCKSDYECRADMLCNTIEIPAPRCRRIFSLPLGHVAKEDKLCVTGWTNKNKVCTYPAKSKRVGKGCVNDEDCPTTDPTGRTGRCHCKEWWEAGNSKYCIPVVGDLRNHLQSVRDLEQFKADNCGKFYTDEECLEEFPGSMGPLKNAVEGEMQCLSGGPYLPSLECNLGDGDGEYLDYCLLSGGNRGRADFAAKGLSELGSAFGGRRGRGGSGFGGWNSGLWWGIGLAALTLNYGSARAFTD